ncbi:uncharacterized protein LOC112896976 isoform X2 [Panicum hallii]|uniref:uncharacterized protein LOC112896976 isoform X2 n=1 Tax=Panicum hallii TaxID=206008 RepID=UPI000DF4E41D|nr:uncharacterized protein LOC112896976 isoform X2 [Panicum hallii]
MAVVRSEEPELGLGVAAEVERGAVGPEEPELAGQPRPVVDADEPRDLPRRPGLPVHPERHHAVPERGFHGGAAGGVERRALRARHVGQRQGAPGRQPERVRAELGEDPAAERQPELQARERRGGARVGVAGLHEERELHVIQRALLVVHQGVQARRPDGQVRRPGLQQQHHHQHGHRRQQHHDGQHREHHRRRPLQHARPVAPEVVVPLPPVRAPPGVLPPVAAAVTVALLLLLVAVALELLMPVAVAVALLMPVAVDAAAAVSLVVLLGMWPVLVREAIPAGRHGGSGGELQRQAAAAAACQHQARGEAIERGAGGIQLSDGVPCRAVAAALLCARGERRRRGRCPARGEFVRAVAGKAMCVVEDQHSDFLYNHLGWSWSRTQMDDGYSVHAATAMSGAGF